MPRLGAGKGFLVVGGSRWLAIKARFRVAKVPTVAPKLLIPQPPSPPASRPAALDI
jgi:hypothetical protein